MVSHTIPSTCLYTTTVGNSGWGTTTTWFESQDINSSPDGEQICYINLDHKSDSCHHPHRKIYCWGFQALELPALANFSPAAEQTIENSSCLGHDLSSTIYYNNYLWQPNASFFLSSLLSLWYVSLKQCQWTVPSDVPSVILGYFGLIPNVSSPK